MSKDKRSPILYLGHPTHTSPHRCDDCSFYSSFGKKRECELNPDYEYSNAQYNVLKKGVLPRNHSAAVCCDKHPMWNNYYDK